MKKKILYLFLILAISAQAYASGCENEVKEAARMIYGERIDTIYSIDQFVENRTNYTFYGMKRSMCAYWSTTRGDCTDKAFLKKYMIDSLKLDNVTTRIVHGWAYGNDWSGKHDGLEVKVDGKVIEMERLRFSDWKKKGSGMW